jgi:hypothetical protein
MYGSAVGRIRDTAKWVLTTLGAVGAVLVSGIGLTSLANVHGVLYLSIALGGLVAALVGVAVSIVLTASVLLPSTVTFDRLVSCERDAAEVQDEKQKIEKWPKYLRPLCKPNTTKLRGLTATYDELQNHYWAALRTRGEALNASYSNPDNGALADRATAANQRVDLYGGVIDEINAHAAFLEIRHRIHPYRQALAAVTVVAGVCAFAITLALPTWKSPDLHGATLRNVKLDGVVLQRADFSGMTLRNVGLRDADLHDAKFDHARLNRVDLTGANVSGASFTSVTWIGSVCPDGTPSDVDGHRCTNHDTARAASLAPPPVPHHKKHKHKHQHKKLKLHGARAHR